MSIKIEWKIVDGYINNGDQESFIHDFDIEDCETEEEVKKAVDGVVDEDYQQRISWELSDDGYALAIARWKELKLAEVETE